MRFSMSRRKFVIGFSVVLVARPVLRFRLAEEPDTLALIRVSADEHLVDDAGDPLLWTVA